jgi:hypothetical protein
VATDVNDSSDGQQPTNPLGWLQSAMIVLVAGTGLLLFVVRLVTVWHATVDDAFITFRYSSNLAHFGAPVWNLGDPHPAEGYTSFLWMVLMAIPHLFHFGAVVFSKVLGVACTCATILVSARLAWAVCRSSDPSIRRLAAVLVVPILIASPAVAIHAVSGMETALFTFLATSLLLIAIFLHRSAVSSASQQRLVSALLILGLLLVLTHPEGILLLLAAAATLVLGKRGPFSQLAPTDRHRLLLQGFWLFLLPAVVFLSWRIWYYRHLFPLSFYVKVGAPSSRSHFDGAKELLAFLREIFIAQPLFGLSLVIGVVKVWRIAMPALVAVLVHVLFFAVPKPIMAFEWRFLFPVLPFLTGLAAVGLGNLLAWLSDRIRLRATRTPMFQRAAGAFCIGSVAVTLQIWAHSSDGTRRLADFAAYGRAMQSAHIPLGKALRRLGGKNPGNHSLATGEAGAIPYYSGWRTVDIFGLNNVQIATSHDRDMRFVLAGNPEIVVLVSSSPTEFVAFVPWEGELYSLCSAAGYQRLDTLFFDARSLRMWLWVLGKPGTKPILG